MTTPSWFVEVVHVTNRHKQQQVLGRLQGVAGLTASGVSSGHDHFVVVGCLNDLMRSAVEVHLSEIDHDAVCTYISGPEQRSHLTPGLLSVPWTGSLN